MFIINSDSEDCFKFLNLTEPIPHPNVLETTKKGNIINEDGLECRFCGKTFKNPRQLGGHAQKKRHYD
jgi:hypothetical protein